jgi:3'-phosphoadenosine 5'-phosphosulfate sulfotransferase (PAPS reductase)/FAD synthetase
MITMQEAAKDILDPATRHIVPVSGGKDSAAMAIYLRQKYPELPFEYVFSDTQCELPETYAFLEKLEALLGKKIAHINALDYLKVKRKPNRNVFDFFLNELYGGFLPSPRARWCTINLKIKPFEKYIGSGKAYSYIGIRGDEDRQGYVPAKKPPKISEKPNIIPVYPFKDDGIILQDVKEILERSGLGLPTYYNWRSRSGCYFCFYQQIGEWQGLIEKHPKLFKKAKTYEKTTGSNKYTWVEGRTLTDIENLPVRYEIQDMDDAEGCAICHI